MLADGTDGSSRGMGRVSDPSTRHPQAAAPMRRLPSAAGPLGGCRGAPRVGGVTAPDEKLQDARWQARPALASAHRPLQAEVRLRAATALAHFSTTWSARASNDGGIVRPRALAVLRLTTRSNLVGCSTGKSAGLAPLRILST